MNTSFQQWALSFSGCDGGDIGSPVTPSIWFCGIEWGGGHKNDKDELMRIFSVPDNTLPNGYSDYYDEQKRFIIGWTENLTYRFNRQAMKLLSAFNGLSVSEYKQFAEQIKPFSEGSKGYFKMNIYPLSFKNTSHKHWKEGFSEATGFETKSEYKLWIQKNRFPVMKSWVEQHKPKVIICTGITYLDDFKSAFADNDMQFNHEVIEGRDLIWGKKHDGSVIFIVPFMSNPNGLTRDVAIQAFGERMKWISTPNFS